MSWLFFFVFRYVVLYVLATIWNSDIMTSPGKDVTVRRTVSRWSAVWVTYINASIHTYRNVIVFYSNFLKILPRETLRDDTAPASIDVCVRSLNLLLETTRFTVRLRFSFLLSRVSFIFSVVCVVFNTHTHTRVQHPTTTKNIGSMTSNWKSALHNQLNTWQEKNTNKCYVWGVTLR